MTWNDIAQATGFSVCLSPDICDADELAHRNGYVTGNTIHWTTRRITRGGIRRFLLLAADAAALDSDIPLWQQIWAMNHYVTERARELGLRLPRKLSELDRTTVRYLLSKDKRGDAQVRQLARKWAHN